MTGQDKNYELAPKTCSIERLITVPQDIKKVLNGQKTATRRNGRYADVGEIMNLDDKHFEVTNVYKQTLGELTDKEANQEGYDTVEEYKHSILSNHPGMPWLSKMEVWVHEFAPVNKN
ncbi:ASCH domain-containing protein [Virgibacillus flavescens]|uniref:ASCH domain-containing protein n=1 Tax=Virgibacillus flavescens TaxID=1611422 RepID=UPI003D3253EE